MSKHYIKQNKNVDHTWIEIHKNRGEGIDLSFYGHFFNWMGSPLVLDDRSITIL